MCWVCSSLVESEHPVSECCPERAHTVNAPVAAMVFVDPPEQCLMSAIAEWGVGRHLAVAQLEVTWLAHIERDGSATGHYPLALTVAKGRVLGVTARAPVVHLSTMEVHVSGVETSEGGHWRRSVLAFLIGAWLSQVNAFLQREICHIIHRDLSACSRWL